MFRVSCDFSVRFVTSVCVCSNLLESKGAGSAVDRPERNGGMSLCVYSSECWTLLTAASDLDNLYTVYHSMVKLSLNCFEQLYVFGDCLIFEMLHLILVSLGQRRNAVS